MGTGFQLWETRVFYKLITNLFHEENNMVFINVTKKVISKWSSLAEACQMVNISTWGLLMCHWNIQQKNKEQNVWAKLHISKKSNAGIHGIYKNLNHSANSLNCTRKTTTEGVLNACRKCSLKLQLAKH